MIRDAVVLAHWYAQSFKWGEHADLWDFCGQLGRIIPPDHSAIRSWCGKVQRAIEDAVDKRTWYGGPEFQHAHGISIYFPWSARDVARGYRRLKFAQETGWADFLGVYLQTTRRLRRAPDEKAKPRRMGSDFEEFLESVDLSWREAATYQDSKVASYFGSKVASYYGSKVASPFGSKVASPFESRVASPYESKMLGGKIISPANFQNVPDGYFRQKIGAANVFIDNEGVPHPEKPIGRKS